MIGALASLPLPAATGAVAGQAAAATDPLQAALFERHRIEVPITSWPVPAALDDAAGDAPRPVARVLRVSAQAYNRVEDYEQLAVALRGLRSGPR